MNSPSPEQAFFAGVDGGGTSTRVLIATADGAICGQGFASGCNPSELGPDLARRRLQEAFGAAWRSLSIAPQPLAGVFFGLAGYGAFRAREPSSALTDGLIPLAAKGVIEWDNDLRIALAGGLAGGEGIALIAGTGSSCYGRTQEGRTWQAGGWGPLLDDVGGGYWLGLETLKHVCREYDGRGQKTGLTERLKKEFGLGAPAEILAMIKSSTDARKNIAEIAPLVFEAKATGDLFAMQLVEKGAQELGRLITAVAEKLFFQRRVKAVFMGGLSKNADYHASVQRQLAPTPQIEWGKPAHSPLIGAFLLALRKANREPSLTLWTQLKGISESF